MRAAFKGLIDPTAFEFVDVSHDGINVVRHRWVFAWKVDKDAAIIIQKKARLVARGLSQVRTLGLLGIYTSTPASSSVKLLVAIAVENGWEW